MLFLKLRQFFGTLFKAELQLRYESRCLLNRFQCVINLSIDIIL